MHCRVCGYRLSRDAVICGECGSVVGTLEPEIFPDSFSQSFPVNYLTGSLSGGVEDTRLLQPGAEEKVGSAPQRGKHSETDGASAAPTGSEAGAAGSLTARVGSTPAAAPTPVAGFATRAAASAVPGGATSAVTGAPAVPSPAVPSPEMYAVRSPAMPAAVGSPASGNPAVGPGREAPPRSAPRHVLTSLTGERLVITGHSVLGRRPQSDDPEMHLLTLVDRTRSVSKTHLELGVVDGMLWVCDLSSANGTIVVMPDGSRVDTAPGQHYSVPPGAHLLLGLAELVVD